MHTLKMPQKHKPDATPYKMPPPASALSAPSHRRVSCYWHETVAKCDVTTLDKMQIERQEVRLSLYVLSGMF